MDVVCPFCQNVVTPEYDVQGRKVCPACRNTGQVAYPPPAFDPPYASPPSPLSYATPNMYAAPVPEGRNSPGSTAALVLGILGLVFLGYGLIFGILAVIFGMRARRAITRNPGLAGDGLAKAGLIMGWISIAVGLVFVLIFVLVLSIAPTDSEGPTQEVAVILQPGQAHMVGFTVYGSTQDVSFSCDSDAGGTCQVIDVYDWRMPHRASADSRAAGYTNGTYSRVDLPPGDYAVWFECPPQGPPCRALLRVTPWY